MMKIVGLSRYGVENKLTTIFVLIQMTTLRQKVKERIVLRIEFPGICALFFEEVLQVIIEELIG